MLSRNNLKMVSYIDIEPLSQPVIDRLLEWHDNNKAIYNTQSTMELGYPWNHSIIRAKSGHEHINMVPLDYGIVGSRWNKEFVDMFPEIVEHFNNLPFDAISAIVLLETVKECPAHMDASKLDNYRDVTLEPCNYRMTIRHSNSPGFWVAPLDESRWGIRWMLDSSVKMEWAPEIGRWWALNNHVNSHGSHWEQGDKKVIVSVQGTPNSEKHKALLANTTEDGCIFHPDAGKERWKK